MRLIVHSGMVTIDHLIYEEPCIV